MLEMIANALAGASLSASNGDARTPYFVFDEPTCPEELR